jgi:hypothetical protein
VQANVWTIIDLNEATYQRCDSQGCDKYNVQITRSGEYLVIDAPGRGLTAKLSTAGDFTEVATMMNTALVSFGKCR